MNEATTTQEHTICKQPRAISTEVFNPFERSQPSNASAYLFWSSNHPKGMIAMWAGGSVNPRLSIGKLNAVFHPEQSTSMHIPATKLTRPAELRPRRRDLRDCGCPRLMERTSNNLLQSPEHRKKGIRPSVR